MPQLKTLTAAHLQSYIRKRPDETKLGEHVQTLPDGWGQNFKALHDSDAKFVLLGLPEDIGVRANSGRGGAQTAWQPALSNILNIQSNHFLRGNELLVLGHIDFSDLMQKADKLDNRKDADLQLLRNLVEEIDRSVSPVIEEIIKAGKTPIIIGGGHNNAYGNLKGLSSALQKKVNCLNIDAHSDLRPMEGRHSGNGFRYAFEEGYLNKYAVLGLHENYNSEVVFNFIKSNAERINISIYEDIFVREKISFQQALDKAIAFIGEEPAGLEIDLDSIQNIPSSARTSSGISANDARMAVFRIAENSNMKYLHIAEGAPVLSHIKTDNKTGKLIAYLVTDFIKASLSYHRTKIARL